MGDTSVEVTLVGTPSRHIVAAIATIGDVTLERASDGALVLLDKTRHRVDLIGASERAVVIGARAKVRADSYRAVRFTIYGAYVARLNEVGLLTIYATPRYDALPADVPVGGELRVGGATVRLPFLEATPLEPATPSRVLVYLDLAQSVAVSQGANGQALATLAPRGHVTCGEAAATLRVYLRGGDELLDRRYKAQLLDKDGLLEREVDLEPIAGARDDRKCEAVLADIDPLEGPFVLVVIDEAGQRVYRYPKPIEFDVGGAGYVDVWL